MACTEMELLLHAYLDGELDLRGSLDVEKHLEGCADCAAEYVRHRALQQALHQENLRFRMDPALRKRVDAALRKEQGVRGWRWLPRAAWGTAIAAVLAGVLLVPRFLETDSAADEYVESVTTDHVRSLMADHLVDVKSSDLHTVQGWFQGRLTYSPPGADLGSQGFTLLGGRLDLMDDMQVAALVYRSGDHTINVFVCPKSDEPLPERLQADQDGYHVVHWRGGELDYWVISDLDAADLQRFSSLFQAQT